MLVTPERLRVILVVPVTNYEHLNLKILRRKRKTRCSVLPEQNMAQFYDFVALFSLEADVVLQEKLATVTIRDVLILQIKW